MPVPIKRLRTTLVLGLAVAIGLVIGSAARAATPSLYANYSSNCTFAWVTDGGGAVGSVPPGTYDIVIFTPFAFGNGFATCDFVQFHLTGPGVDLYTDLGGGDLELEQHTVTLQAGGTYTVQDDGRPALTRRTFTISTSGSAQSSGSTTSSSSSSSSSGAKGTVSKDIVGSAIAPFRGTLNAAVSASGNVALARAGKGVSSIKAGRYTLHIVDAAKTAGFALQTVKSRPKTLSSPAFTGTRAVTIPLTAGQWYFFTPGGIKHPFIVAR
jgi:hypothetical protein